MGKINLPESLKSQIISKILTKVKPNKIALFDSSVKEDDTSIGKFDIVLFGVKGGRFFLLKDILNKELPSLKGTNLVLFDTLKSGKQKTKIFAESIVIYEKSDSGHSGFASSAQRRHRSRAPNSPR
jgi:hypothetical protein